MATASHASSSRLEGKRKAAGFPGCRFNPAAVRREAGAAEGTGRGWCGVAAVLRHSSWGGTGDVHSPPRGVDKLSLGEGGVRQNPIL